MPSRSMQYSQSVTLDGSGNGQVQFGPTRTTWIVKRASVRTSTAVNMPTAVLYRGTVNPGSIISDTYSGSGDTDSDINEEPLYPGQFYTCRWTGGDAGALATISYSGTEETP